MSSETRAPGERNCPLCRSQVSTDALLEAAKDDEEAEEDSDLNFDDIEVTLSSTKVMAVLKELKGTREKFPNDKTIIVSQFTSFLSIFQVSKNNINLVEWKFQPT